MRISDWSSDVCSSDLHLHAALSVADLAVVATQDARTLRDQQKAPGRRVIDRLRHCGDHIARRSEEHTSELQSLMRISYAVFCLKKKRKTDRQRKRTHNKVRTTRHKEQLHQTPL